MPAPTTLDSHLAPRVMTTGAVTAHELDHAVQVFLAERTRLLRVAYRVVGDSAAAEDVVQEAWIRWQRVDRRSIKNPAAFLTTATTHLAINVIQSARHRHELPTETPRESLSLPTDPTHQAESAAGVSRILGALMVKLSPAELAAFILRKCFDYPYDAIADALGTSAANVRQLVRRAHLGLASGRVRPVDREVHQRLVSSFLDANQTGNVTALVDLLADRARSTPCCTKSRVGAARVTRSTGSARTRSVTGSGRNRPTSNVA